MIGDGAYVRVEYLFVVRDVRYGRNADCEIKSEASGSGKLPLTIYWTRGQ